MRYFIVSPANIASGGTELLHQLSWSLTCRGVENYIWYPGREPHLAPTPESFLKYQAKYVSSFVDDEESVLICPESGWFSYQDACTRGIVIFWWLSVNGYLEVYQDTIRRMNKMDIFDTGGGRFLHFVQSKYALEFVNEFYLHQEQGDGQKTAYYLTDYINEDIVRTAEQYREECVRQNVIVYNPKKGAENLVPLAKKCRKDITWMPLQGLTPVQMAMVMCTAKVYIDFGGHPGKDRIPREAAVCGCCVITNRLGSAAHSEDVGIPEEYRIEDMTDHARILDLIYDLIDHYDQKSKQFEPYIASILREKEQFEREVDDMLRITEAAAAASLSRWKGSPYGEVFQSMQTAISGIHNLCASSQELYQRREIGQAVTALLHMDYMLSKLRETNYMVIEDILSKEDVTD